MRPAETAQSNASRLSMVIFIVVGLATAMVGFWHWQPLPSDPKTFSTEPSAPAVPLNARSYLSARPFDPVAYVGVTQELLTSQPVIAQETLRVAAQLAPVDPIVMRARIADAYARKDLQLAMTLSADLAVLSPGDSADAFALLASVTRTPEWPKFFASKLSTGWAAANGFVTYACNSGIATDVLLPLATAIGQKQPLPPATLNCVAAKAIAANQTQAAYWLWLNATTGLPKKIPFVLNGDFESPLSGGPFDWKLGVGGDFREGFTLGLIRDNATRAIGNGYLSIRFNARAIRSVLAQQNLALLPGRYSLSYRSQMAGLAADKMAWAIRCGVVAVGLTPAGSTNAVSERDWTAHSAEFVVPSTCFGQVLTLEVATRLDALQGLLGSANYDDVIIKRL